MTPPPATARANSDSARDIASVLHPYTDARAHEKVGPVIITRGEGVRVWDENGKAYIDTAAGLWCASLGFSNDPAGRRRHPADAAIAVLPLVRCESHTPMIELAEMLLARAPVPMSKVFFANSGSEANDTAIKLIWFYNNGQGRHQKKKIIGRIKGYHGITVASGSLTGLPYNHKSFDIPLPGFVHTITPHFYHGALPGETEDTFADRCAAELEALILREGPETVAAMWAEPIMGAGGVILPPRGYFRRSRRF